MAGTKALPTGQPCSTHGENHHRRIPTLDPATIDAAELSELQGEKSDLESAIALFTPETPASSLVVNLGQPVAR